MSFLIYKLNLFCYEKKVFIASAGTFTSCKDYDDDISNLQGQIDGVAADVANLQAQINAGKWITNVAAIEGGFTVTFSDGQTFDIVNGAAGAAGTQITIGEDGYWYFDGEKSNYLAVANGETGKINVPYVNTEDGYWYFYNEEGEAVKSAYKAVGAAYAVAANGGYNLYLPNENGEMNEAIFLPGAGASITDMELTDLNGEIAQPYKLTIYNTEFNFDSQTGDVKSASDWKGTKTLPADKSVVYSTNELGLRINPTNVDGTDVEYVLTNSQNITLSHIALKASEFKGLLKTRAAYGNGLYTLKMDNTVFTSDEAKEVNADLAKYFNAYFAVNADRTIRTDYKIEMGGFALGEKLTDLTVKNLQGAIAGVGSSSCTWENVKVGETYTVDAIQASSLYDMYFVVDDATKNAYDVVVDNENHTFTVNKNPDSSSLEAKLPIAIYTAANNGTVNKTVVTLSLDAAIPSTGEYAEITTDVSTKKDFSFDLATMKEGLGDLQSWLLNVDLANVEYTLYKKYENNKLSEEVSNAFTSGLFKSTVVAADGKTATTDVNKAANIKVAIDNTKASTVGMELDKTYYLEVTYKSKKDGVSVLNTSIVPVKFTAPAFAEFFTIKAGYTNAGEDIINAYFYDKDSNGKGLTAVQLKRYFEDSPKYFDTIAYQEGNVDDTNKKATDLFTQLSMGTTDFSAIEMDLKGDFNADKGEVPAGYGKVVTINVTDDDYQGWKYTTEGDDTYSFQIRLMSPIYEGDVTPAEGNSIVINGNELKEGFDITSDMIIGADYNGNKYNVVPDGVGTNKLDKVNGVVVDANAAWAEPQIEYAVPQFDKNKYIKELKVTAASSKDGKVTANGTFNLKGESISQDVTFEMPVKVKDIWGYELTVNVPVTITRTAE